MSSSLSKLVKEFSRQELEESVIRQGRRIRELQDEVTDLREENQKLKEKLSEQVDRIEQLERAVHRQAAPFRREKDKRKEKPSSPGRKKGHEGNYKKRSDKEVSERIEVGLEECPNCGKEVKQIQPVKQVIEEIPPVQPRIVELTTYRGHCSTCGEVRSTHPLQVSRAEGAAGTHLGPNTIALLIKLRHRFGLSKRKCCDFLREEAGIDLTPGGLSQLLHRIADKLSDEYETLKDKAKAADQLHVDETSWYVGEPGYWLWTFTNDHFTLYKVDQSRGREVIEDMLGNQFDGVMISDCLVIYEGVAREQQKCYAHHLKTISQALRETTTAGKYLKKWQHLLKEAMQLKENRKQYSKKRYHKKIQHLQDKADQLLRKPRDDPSEQKIANRLEKQKEHLFTFLKYPNVPATNNQAERQLRPAVISRKISCGNRTSKGAHTWEVLTSLMATCQQQNRSFEKVVKKAVKIR